MKLRIPAFAVFAVGLVGHSGCKGHGDAPSASGSANAAVDTAPSKSSKPLASTTSTSSATPSGSSSATAAGGKPPPDGKYERVIVEGVTVPMIEVMDGGTVVLVDTDGKKPRTWEEQYKRKRDSLPVGSFDIHKVDANKNNKFDDDPIDKEGLWVIDEKGNITKH
jgi:hypothetical protein